AGFYRYELGVLAASGVVALQDAIDTWGSVAAGAGLDALMDSLAASQVSGLVTPRGLRLPVAGSNLDVRLTLEGVGADGALKVAIETESEEEVSAFRWSAAQGDLLAISRHLDATLVGLGLGTGYFTATPEVHRVAATLHTAGVRLSPSGFGPPLTFGVSHVNGEWIRAGKWVFSSRDRRLTFDLARLPSPHHLHVLDASRPGLRRVLGGLLGSQSS
ncbi:MAG: hypothetical protein ACRCYU_19770, partial [Nocardioides sp.]